MENPIIRMDGIWGVPPLMALQQMNYVGKELGISC